MSALFSPSPDFDLIECEPRVTLSRDNPCCPSTGCAVYDDPVCATHGDAEYAGIAGRGASRMISPVPHTEGVADV